MKIYLFDPESGIYQGEDFADDLPMCPGRGVIPPYATAIAPPSYVCGEVPVFISRDQQWQILPVSAAKSRWGG
jgi:hypothetical protein